MVHPRSSAPQVFGPSPVEVLSRRSKSAGPGLPGRRKGQRRKATALETERPWLDPCEVKAPRGGQRWFPDRVPTYGAAVRKEARGLLNRRPQGNDFSGWQMNFPAELPSGAHCPICTLGECGDVNCPTYRPKHPEVREAIEEFVVAKCLESLSTPAWTLNTYVSVGSGLLAQDWIMLETPVSGSRASAVPRCFRRPQGSGDGAGMRGESVSWRSRAGYATDGFCSNAWP